MRAAKRDRRRVLVVAVVTAITMLVVAAFVYFTANSAGCARAQARWSSQYGYGTDGYGVERHVVLYSFDGQVVDEWRGRIDVQYRTGNMADLVFFTGKDTVERRVVVNIGYGQLVVDSTINGG